MSDPGPSTPQVQERRSAAMPDDEAIITSAKAALEHDGHLHPAEITVSCQAGSVTLRGTVATPRQRSIAHEIAKSVPGVRAVDVQLRVDLRDRFLDDEIRGSALQALIADGPERVDVFVSD